MRLAAALIDRYASGLLPRLAADLRALGVDVVGVGDALPDAQAQQALSPKPWVAVIGGRTLEEVRRRVSGLVATLTGPVPVIAVVPSGVPQQDLHGPHIVDVLSPDTRRCAERVALMSAVPVVTRQGKGRVNAAAAARLAEGRRGALITPPLGGHLPPLVALASSTGGVTVVLDVLRGLGPKASEAVLLAQHIQAEFVACFASWLTETSGWPVEVVSAAIELRAGVVYIAAGGLDLCVDGFSVVGLLPVSALIPNADRLFRSVAARGGGDAAGVVLSGMGSDGAAGLLDLARAGAATLCQLPATAALPSMPSAALAAVPQALARAPADLSVSIRAALSRRRD